MANFATQIPIIGGFFDDSDQKILELMAEQKRRAEALGTPEFGEYKPEQYAYQTVQEDPRIRQSQLQYLQRLQSLADTGLGEEDLAAFEAAKRGANQLARQREEALISNAQSRGVAGGGLEFALRQQAQQDAAERARASQMEQAAQAARQRALAIQAYGQGLQSQRGQDFDINRYNTDLINRFNQANTDLRNQAFKYNQDNQQRAYENQLRRLGVMSEADKGSAQGYAAQSALAAGNRRALGAAIGAGVGMYAAGNPAAGAQAGGDTAAGGTTGNSYDYAKLGSLIGGGY